MKINLLSSILGSKLCRFFEREHGVISVATAIILPALFMVSGIAIDISDLNAQRKFVQNQADLASLSGIRNLSDVSTARGAAVSTVLSSQSFVMSKPADGDVLFGRIDPEAGFIAHENQSSLDGVTAVRVIARSPARFPVLGRFFFREVQPLVSRPAVSVAQPRVSFSLSNCLLSLHLLNGLLEPLLGAEADLLCSGEGLRINALTLMGELAARGRFLSPATTYGDVLDAEFPLVDILDAAYGQTTGLTPREMPDFASEPLRLGDFLHVAPGLRAAKVSNTVLPPLEFYFADLVFGSLEVLGTRVIDLQAKLALGEVAGASVALRISEPRVVVLGAVPGDPEAVARTAQIRLKVEDLQLSPLLRLSLGLNVASSSATLSPAGRHCSPKDQDLAAVFAPVSADLLDADLALQLSPVPGIFPPGLLRQTRLMESSTTSLEFTHEDVAAGTSKTLRADRYRPDIHGPESIGRAVEGLVAELKAHGVGKNSSRGRCQSASGCLLEPVTAVLDPVHQGLTRVLSPQEHGVLQMLLEDALGFAFVETRLEVLDVACQRRLAI